MGLTLVSPTGKIIGVWHNRSIIKAEELPKPLNWALNLLKKHKAKQNELTRKKISALQKKAYDYHLTLYIDRIIKLKKADFHPYLYLSGEIVCAEAEHNAINDVVRIVQQGEKAINECYSILVENNRQNRKRA